MKPIPDYMFNEMLAITKVFAERYPANSTRHINAVRRAGILNKKMQKYNSSDLHSKQNNK